MKKTLYLALALAICSAAVSCSTSPAKETGTQKNTPVGFSDVHISDSFWQPRIESHAAVTAPFCIDQCANVTGRVSNFAVAAGLKEGSFSGIFYDDSDLYKSIEGVAYSLQNVPNPTLEAQVDSIIDIIAAAQQPDGYLNTYYTIVEPENRYTNMDQHEDYCAGHLIEGAIAYYHSTGKRKLLDVAIKLADNLCNTFGEGKKDWVSGHEEIELALVKLYRETGDRKYLDLAHFFLQERGHGKGTWRQEAMDLEYHQDVVPVDQLEKITGHAVRAMYLLTGMADYSAAAQDTTYLSALQRVWDDLVESKMYITGGIGAAARNEGFDEDFYLPNKEAYCETCASVGMVFWNQRMNMLFGDGKYEDILEKDLYNGVLDGISLSSDLFFYVNPLASDGDHHRQPWFSTACCPSNVSRFLPSVGGYIFATSPDALWVNQYIGSTASMEVGKCKVDATLETEYPWDGKVTLKVNPSKSSEFTLKLRIPSWCKTWKVSINGHETAATDADGYADFRRKWKAGDEVVLDMDMPVEVVAADPRVKEDEGLRAICRGPIVYCAEEVDNPDFDSMKLSPATDFVAKYEKDILGGVTTITAVEGDSSIRLIPYYAWDNRSAGKMAVWLKWNE